MLIDWMVGSALKTACPLCRAEGDKPQRLVVWDRAIDGTPYRLYDCPACGSAFFDPQPEARYEAPANAEGAIKFYVEQGAGLDVMLEPTAVLDKLAVHRYLEIGCGFGFSLDYATRARGWLARGYDPGLLAQAGRSALGLDIRSAYFGVDTPFEHGAWDAVLCSEVIEHVHDPDSFLLEVRKALADDGVLVLTTPNAAGIRPDTDLGALLPLLSAGFHTMLFSARALDQALRLAGFSNVRVGGSLHQLHAVASNRALPDEQPFDRMAYRNYLAERAGLHDAETSLGAGFRYRLLKELANTGRYEEAKTLLDELAKAWQRVYSIDLTVPESIRIPEPGAMAFDALAARFPLNLCGVLYTRGIVQINAVGDAASAARSFGAAAAFAAALRSALQEIGTDDGETADLCAHALCEQALALARVDPPGAVRHYGCLVAAQDAGPIISLPAALLERTRHRLIVGLVNAGAYEAADTLVEEGDEALVPQMIHPDLFAERLSLLFVLGMLALNHRANYPVAAETFHRVFAACREIPDASGSRTLLWAARYHEALALSYSGNVDAARRVAVDLIRPNGSGDPEIPAAYQAWAQRLEAGQS